MIHIYALIDPRDKQVRYVGKTIHLRLRFQRHLSPSSKCIHCSTWIQSLLSIGLKPELITLELLEPDSEWEVCERKWITHFRQNGVDLTNLTEGGEGGGTLGRLGKKNSPEHIRKSSRPGVPVQHTPESDKKRADGVRAYYARNKKPVFQYNLSGEFVATWPSAVDAGLALGIQHSGITKVAKKGQGRAGEYQWLYEEHIEIPSYIQQVAWNNGLVLNDETRNKISSSKKGIRWSDARRAAQKKK